MAKTDQLLNQIADAQLRTELKAAIEELKKAKSFGLVFEEHLPEFVPLPGLPIRHGDLVSRTNQPDAGLFTLTFHKITSGEGE